MCLFIQCLFPFFPSQNFFRSFSPISNLDLSQTCRQEDWHPLGSRQRRKTEIELVFFHSFLSFLILFSFLLFIPFSVLRILFPPDTASCHHEIALIHSIQQIHVSRKASTLWQTTALLLQILYLCIP